MRLPGIASASECSPSPCLASQLCALCASALPFGRPKLDNT
jgi:hypothetical protein